MSVLETTDLCVRYGGVHALTDVSMTVPDGQLVGLIGPNGAGKTTFIDAITGFTHSRGGIEFQGTQISSMSPHARARRGLTRTWQSTELFDDLTVCENIAVAAGGSPSPAQVIKEVLSKPRSRTAEAFELLDRFELREFADALPTELAHGQRKLIGVLRALANRPRMLCLDEPAAGLDTYESQELGQRLRTVVDTGVAGLLIDHDMGLVLGTCDYVYVLDFGRVIAHGTPDDVRRNPTVIAAYLGSGENPEEGQDHE